MKKKSLLLCLPLTVFILFTSFTGNNSYLIGKWNISAVGTADPKLVKKIDKGADSARAAHYKKYLPELSTMLNEGYVYEFVKDGTYNIKDKNGKEAYSGDYTLSEDGETLTLITSGDAVDYKYTKISDKHIKLKSKKDASTIELSKKM